MKTVVGGHSWNAVRVSLDRGFIFRRSLTVVSDSFLHDRKLAIRPWLEHSLFGGRALVAVGRRSLANFGSLPISISIGQQGGFAKCCRMLSRLSFALLYSHRGRERSVDIGHRDC